MAFSNLTLNDSVKNISQRPRYMRAYRWLLLGYAIYGRTFAYVGFPPFFIGEIFLALGLMSAPLAKALPKLLTNLTFILFVALLLISSSLTVWGAFHFNVFDALRDGAVWGYGLFALIVAAHCLADPTLIKKSLSDYGRIIPTYILIAPLLAILSSYFVGRLPNLPLMEVTALELKAPDVMVHLAGMFALVYLGFRKISNVYLFLMLLAVLALSSLSRGGFSAFVCASLALFILKPRLQFIASTIGATIVAVAIFSFIDLEIRVFGRSISSEQLMNNLASIFNGGDDPIDLGGTRSWRLEWWRQIFQYTFHGDYFWFGKGFGINLASADGFQVDVDWEKLRSPHNSNMTFLARGGVPLFFVWVLLQLAWGISMLRMIFAARRLGLRYWEHVGIFLMAYWVAMTVNMNFDVYLEGPMGGIWFWTIWGYGIALQWLMRYRRDILIEISR